MFHEMPSKWDASRISQTDVDVCPFYHLSKCDEGKGAIYPCWPAYIGKRRRALVLHIDLTIRAML